MNFVYGENDPSFTSTSRMGIINKKSIKLNRWGDKGHVFDADTLEFDLYVFLNSQMYTKEKYIVDDGNEKAFNAVLLAHSEGTEKFYPRKGYVLYLYGEKGCGKTHLLNMVLNHKRKEGNRVELDDAEELYDFDEFIIGYRWNDIAMIDNVDRLDGEGLMILKEVINYTNFDKNDMYHGPIMILTSKKSPEETFTDKELVSIIRQGKVVEIS